VPTAELIKPKSYNHLGRIWKQGREVEITQELAAELEDNPRFRIRGFDAARCAPAEGGKPKGRDELHEAIRDAAGRLDVDNEVHFTVTGKPECHALSEILGYPVTATDRDQAIGVVRKATVEAAEPKQTRFKIKKGHLTPPPAEPKSETVSHLPAEAPAVPATDPTTLNAIEVN
jgi:hypothetical protein